MSAAHERVVLRYFDCRSRGQALRFALWDAGIEFDDARTPVEDLERFQEDAQRSDVGGPFAALPVLEWDGHRVAETLAIAAYLAARLGQEPFLRDAETRSLHDMVVSAAHLGMQVPYSRLLWLPGDCSEESLRAMAAALLGWLRTKLGQLDDVHREIAGDAVLFGGTRPAMSDAFVYESLSRGCAVFGAPFESSLAASPHMAALRRAMRERPGIAEARARGAIPERVTASPSEPDVRRRLRDLDLS